MVSSVQSPTPFFEYMITIITFLSLLCLGYGVGSYIETKHYKEIKQREHKTRHITVINYGAKQKLPPAYEADIFVGSVVISADYFKMFAAYLRNLVGGRMKAYDSILDRGRREAVLRMKEQAIAWGATKILNMRLETSSINNQAISGEGLFSVEVIAYGTGIK